MNRTKKVSTMLNEEELALLQEVISDRYADGSPVSMSTLVRWLIFNPENQSIHRLTREISR
jgi:hypothetical protein